VLCTGSLKRGTGLRDRVIAARRAGFAGVSLYARDYYAARSDGIRDADIRSMLLDAGLGVADIDAAWDWFADARDLTPAPRDHESFLGTTPVELMSIATAVGARSLNALVVTPTHLDRAGLADGFADLCLRAAEYGLLVHLEFVPWTAVPDLATAWDIVRQAGQPNGGLAIDTWHWFRGDNDVAQLRAIPGDRIMSVQLADAPATPDGDLLDESAHRRQVPGDGELPLTELVAALVDVGAAAPWGVEVYADDVHRLPPDRAARRVGDGARRVLATGTAARR
jgi:sugar phosphate isomerase/epimerase